MSKTHILINISQSNTCVKKLWMIKKVTYLIAENFAFYKGVLSGIKKKR